MRICTNGSIRLPCAHNFGSCDSRCDDNACARGTSKRGSRQSFTVKFSCVICSRRPLGTLVCCPQTRLTASNRMLLVPITRTSPFSGLRVKFGPVLACCASLLSWWIATASLSTFGSRGFSNIFGSRGTAQFAASARLSKWLVLSGLCSTQSALLAEVFLAEVQRCGHGRLVHFLSDAACIRLILRKLGKKMCILVRARHSVS